MGCGLPKPFGRMVSGTPAVTGDGQGGRADHPEHGIDRGGRGKAHRNGCQPCRVATLPRLTILAGG